MIQFKQLSKQYNGITVVDIPELEIKQGETFGLVGNNGAGKTTLFRMLLDLVRPTTGNVSSNGTQVGKNEDWKKFTGSYLDEGFLIDFLTPDEYFQFVGNLHGMSKEEVNDFLQQYAEFFNDEVLGKKKYIRDLSKGNQKKVGIVAALIAKPKVVVLDEPFANLDPSTNIRLIKMLKQYNEKYQSTLLISSHDLNHVTEVCDRICVLHKGKVEHDLQTNANTLKTLEDYFSVHGESVYQQQSSNIEE